MCELNLTLFCCGTLYEKLVIMLLCLCLVNLCKFMSPYIVELCLKIIFGFLSFLNWFLILSPSTFQCGGPSKSMSTSSSLGLNFEKKNSNARWFKTPSFEAHVRVQIILLWRIKDVNLSSKVCVVGPLYHRTYLYWIRQLACPNRIFVPYMCHFSHVSTNQYVTWCGTFIG
jgi:hypothetical protein